MKRNLYLVLSLVLVALGAVSCVGEAVMSPKVQYGSAVYRTYATVDTLGHDTIISDTISLADSVQVGDTLRFPLVINGYYDYITSFIVTADTSKVTVSFTWDEELDDFLAPGADPEHGNLTFEANKVYAALTTLVYVPQVPGTHEIDLLLTSAAKQPYSEWQGHFFVGVKKP